MLREAVEVLQAEKTVQKFETFCYVVKAVGGACQAQQSIEAAKVYFTSVLPSLAYRKAVPHT